MHGTREVRLPWLLLAGLSSLLLLLPACTNPGIRVGSSPEGALVHADGIPAGKTPLELSLRYYGTVLIEVDEPPDPGAGRTSQRFRTQTRKVRVEPPVNRWLFPLDLLGEGLARLFGQLRKEVEVVFPSEEPEGGGSSLLEEAEEAAIRR